MTITNPAIHVEAVPEVEVLDGEFDRLRFLNIVMGCLHAVQAVVLLLLANDFTLPVTTTFWNSDPTPEFDLQRFEIQADFPIAAGAAGFLFLSSLFHFATVVGFGRYSADLRRGINRFRWVEYSLSSSLMIVLIMLITGITDLTAFIGLAGVNAAMIWFGWIMEVVNRPGDRVWWTPFVMGSLAGIVPWAAVFVYIIGPGSDVPAWVYAVYVSIFTFFNLFGLNQLLQYRGTGPWRRYLFGERAYIVLSIVAKSALAWQIFGNTLA